MDTDSMFGFAGMGFALLLLVLLVVIIVALTKVWQSKIQSSKEDGFQKLATESIEIQKETAQLNQKLSVELTEVKTRLASIERILKEVE